MDFGESGHVPVSERCKVCCSGVFASQTAYVMCVLLLVVGWCVFAGDFFWTQRHVLNRTASALCTFCLAY